MTEPALRPRSYLPQQRRGWSIVQHGLNAWGRIGLTAITAAIQFAALVYAAVYIARLSTWFLLLNGILAVVAIIVILNSQMPSAYKLAWVFPVLALPIAGVLFYVFFGARKVAPWTRRRFEQSAQAAAVAQALTPVATLPDSAPLSVRQQAQAIRATTAFPLRADTACDYWGFGQDGFEQMLAAIDAAERYIVCEYFIVGDGTMWAQMFDALARKAAAGIDVRFMFDDIGSLFTLPPHFARTLRAAGIKVHRVNPLGMLFSFRYNNRDHRKILAVDGKVAFTGGINIADEYINEKERFGTWKDTVLRLEGPGAWSLTLMSLQLWELISGEEVAYADFAPAALPPRPGSGWALPFSDSPYDALPLGELTYRNQIMRAERSVDIMTPYLVLDDEMLTLLRTVASSGVRVRVLTPGIPDKPYVFAVTRSFYVPLLAAGVEIYEYSPGFLHAKVCCVDDEVAVVGTINFDYRSFYLQQEDGVWMYGTRAVAQVVADFAATVPQCRRITASQTAATPRWRLAGRALLRTFAPLM